MVDDPRQFVWSEKLRKYKKINNIKSRPLNVSRKMYGIYAFYEAIIIKFIGIPVDNHPNWCDLHRQVETSPLLFLCHASFIVRWQTFQS